MPIYSVPASEHHRRIEWLRDAISERGADALCLFSAVDIEWASGFQHLQTERPVCLAITDGTVAITVPRLELDRADSDDYPTLETTYHYYDYPGGGNGTYRAHPSRTPEETIAVMLDDLGADDVIADSNGAPAYWGYTGPPLDEFADVDVRTEDLVGDRRRRKSEVERELIRQSAAWGNLAHEELVEHIEPGKHELRITKTASLEASLSVMEMVGEKYEPHSAGGFPAWCTLRAGPNTALPHGLTRNRRVQAGDVVVTGGLANVGGYRSELERTMFVGPPTDVQRNRFGIMLEAQSIGIEACGPGVACSRVDRAVHDYLDEQGVLEHAQHHTGHNLGMEGHERDFLDRGSGATMQPGHVYSIEPGIYFEEEGYRHSDTVLITEDGTELITYYPRELEQNVVHY